jgi:ABC-2 type transport system permease protein
MTTRTSQPVVTGGSAKSAPSALALGGYRTVLEVKTFFREKDALIFSFLFPIIMLGIFSVVFGGDESAMGGGGPEIDFTQYFLPGMIAAGIFLVSFQTLAITIAIERDDGTLKRLRGTPMPPVSYFLGKIGMVLVTAVAQTVLLLAYAALTYRVELPTEPARWFTFAWVFVLGTAAGTVLGIAYSSVPKSGRSAPAVVTTPVLMLQGMRSVFLPPEFEAAEVSGSWRHGLTAIALVLWLIVGLVLCVRTLRWQRRDAG